MKKKTIMLLVLIIIFIPSLGFTNSSDDNEEPISKEKIIEDQMNNLNIDELQSLIAGINETSSEYLPKLNFKDLMISLVKGEEVVTGEEILQGILKIIFKEVIANFGLLMKILALSIMAAVLTNLQSAFEKDTVGELAFYVCYLLLVVLAVKSFTIAMDIGKAAIEDMVILMQALLPTLITLLLAMGGLTSSALFQPVILGAISAISTLMKDVILPMIFFSAIIGIISNISKQIQISKLSGLLRQISAGVIGVTLTVFIGIMSIQGATAAKVDGVTIRTAKFAVDKFVPIIGKFLSDAMDTVVGCSMLLKNAVGVIGLLALFIICILPIIKIVSLIFIYKLTSALIEPISNTRIVDSLNEISKSLVLILAVVASVGIMFFIAVTIIVGAGNVTIMLR